MASDTSPEPPAAEQQAPPTATAPLAPAAVHFHPEGYATTRTNLMGRHAAGEGFLDAYLRATAEAGEHPLCATHTREAFDTFEERRKQIAPTAPPGAWLRLPGFEGLARSGALYRPDPMLAKEAFLRRRYNQRAYSITGVTHTISSANAMDGLPALLTAPLQSWDAVICTSEAVKASLKRLTDGYSAYLADTLGATAPLRCQLPVIPLGVAMENFPPREDRVPERRGWRERLGIAEDAVAALFLGRLSFHAKAHPAPMFLALEAAARSTGKAVHLILAGWFANEATERAFRTAAQALCPAVTLHVVDGRDLQVRRDIWYVADIFMSLSDNIQETFGLTPIEAMAAGLPSIVTDWNGYKETVRDGVDGFRVATIAQPPGADDSLAISFDAGVIDYDRFVGEASLRVAVDVTSAMMQTARLVGDADLRAQMGASARRRAEDEFAWSRIMERYRALWAELAARRQTDAEAAVPGKGAPNPLRPDPFDLFANYPTMRLVGSTRVTIGPLTGGDLNIMAALDINTFGRSPMLDGPETEALLARVAAGPMTAVELANTLPADRRVRFIRSLLWLAKLGLVRLLPEPAT